MHDPLLLMRKTGWLLFWLLAAVALSIILLFAYATIPALTAVARGGQAGIWSFGVAWLAVSASAFHLVLAAVVFAKKRSRGTGHRPGT